MGEYLRQQYQKITKDLYVDWSDFEKNMTYPNSIKELNDKEKQWRKEHRKELQQSINKLKSTILQEKSNDNK